MCVASGFAFSQQQGQDRLVTDNITNRLKEGVYQRFFAGVFTPGNGAMGKSINDSFGQIIEIDSAAAQKHDRYKTQVSPRAHDYPQVEVSSEQPR